MKFSKKTGRPICENCRRELVTPEDLPRDVHWWDVIEPDWLGDLDETTYRKAAVAACGECFFEDEVDIFGLRPVFYVAQRYEDWRRDREALEDKRLKAWNADMRAIKCRVVNRE